MTLHAEFSPSGSHRWAKCPGSVVLEKHFPETSNFFSDEGSVAHLVAAEILKTPQVKRFPLVESLRGSFLPFGGSKIECTEEMLEHVQGYVGFVEKAISARKASGFVETFVERSLNIEVLTGEEKAKGTVDVMMVQSNGLCVVDLKYGRGVKISAEYNSQLLMYAAAAVHEFRYLDLVTVECVIYQPRLNHTASLLYTMEDIEGFKTEIAASVAQAQQAKKAYQSEGVHSADFLRFLKPGRDQCRFCKAKAVCPALSKRVLESALGGFEDLNAVKKVFI